MELGLTEAVAGGGIGATAIGLWLLMRLVFHLGGIKASVEKFLEGLTGTLAREREHYKTEEAHQARVVDLLERIEVSARNGKARPQSGSHSPVPM